MSVFSSPYGEALLTHLPSRSVYSHEANTIRKLFPKSKRHHSFSVLIYAEDLADVFTGLHRRVGDAPARCTEDTDLIEFLKCNVFEHGDGFFGEALKSALEDPLCIGVTLGIGCVASMDLPQGCRFTNPRWGAKVAAHARRLSAPKPLPGSMTLQELDIMRGTVAIDVDALATSGLERRKWRTLASLQYPVEPIDVEDDDDDVVAVTAPPPPPPPPASGPPPAEADTESPAAPFAIIQTEAGIVCAARTDDSAPGVEQPAMSCHNSSGEGVSLMDAVASSPVTASPAAAPLPPQPRLIELLHVDGCASLLKLRRYIDPVRRKVRAHHNEASTAKAGAKTQTAKKQKTTAPKLDATNRQGPGPRARRNYTVILDEPSVMTRRQRKQIVDAEEREIVESLAVNQRPPRRAPTDQKNGNMNGPVRSALSSKSGAVRSHSELTFAQQQNAARDPSSGRFRPLSERVQAKQDAVTQRRREERREQEQERSSASNPRLFHMVDVAPGKRSRTLWVPPADAVRRRRRRKPKVVVID
jgi:hypothetical protein